jgi:DNA repair protein RecO (recombination protein O)
MLKLPAFMRDSASEPMPGELPDAFALTGFFLSRYVLEPRGVALGEERAHFIAALVRALPPAA